MLECELVLENAALREVAAARTEELAWRSLHDQLTGLPNRALLDDRLESALRATSRSGGIVPGLFIDLPRFKAVNARVGNADGDRVQFGSTSRRANACPREY